MNRILLQSFFSGLSSVVCGPFSIAPIILHLQMVYTLKKSLGQHFLKDENISKKLSHHWKNALSDSFLKWVRAEVH